jgi:chromosomal replication initiation ATPase DnaA
MEKTQLPGRNIKLYLCRKHTSEKLKTLDEQFGIGDAAVAQSYKRFKLKFEKNKNLRKSIERVEERIILSNVET